VLVAIIVIFALKFAVKSIPKDVVAYEFCAIEARDSGGDGVTLLVITLVSLQVNSLNILDIFIKRRMVVIQTRNCLPSGTTEWLARKG
jgi:hypothetical protein